MYDCGVNLSSSQFKGYIDTLKEHSIEANIKGWIVISNGEKEWTSNLSHCKKYEEKDKFTIKCTIGIHPHNAKDVNDNTWEKLENILTTNKDKIVGIGECGLDYNRMFSDKEKQKEVFIKQIEL
jgi:TatD DNase family protein